MLIHTGPRPVHPSPTRVPAGGRWLVALRRTSLALLLMAPWQAVPANPTLTLAEVEGDALDQEPGQLALDARAQALAAEADAAAALPAPAVRLGLNNYPIERGDFSTEGMTSAGLTWRQALSLIHI